MSDKIINIITNIVLGAFNIAAFLFLLWMLIAGILKKKELDNNHESTNAVVTRFYSIKQSDYFKYVFYVDTIQYEGSGRHSLYRDVIFRVGDSIEIVYSSVNPSNNRPKRQYRKHCIIP